MKQFKIKYDVEVYEDSYSQGELNHVNYYNGVFEVNSNSVKEAVKEFFDNELYFDINFDYMELIQDDNLNRFTYSVLCDNDNQEVTQDEDIYKQWLNDEVLLYSNQISFNVYEVVETEIKEIK